MSFNGLLILSSCLPQMPLLCTAWSNILVMHTHPCLIESCLQAVSLYISWIEVSLVVTEQFLGPVFEYLTSREPGLRDGACEFIAALVNKGMPPVKKILMLQSLQVVERISAVREALHTETDADFLARYVCYV